MSLRITGRLARLFLMLLLPQPVFVWWLIVGRRDFPSPLLPALATAGIVILFLLFLLFLQ